MQTGYFYQEDQGTWHVNVDGEVDVATAAELRTLLRKLYEEKAADIVLDAETLRYMDSTGLGVLIGAYGRMQEQEHRILIVQPRENIKKLLRVTTLDRLFCPQEPTDAASAEK